MGLKFTSVGVSMVPAVILSEVVGQFGHRSLSFFFLLPLLPVALLLFRFFVLLPLLHQLPSDVISSLPDAIFLLPDAVFSLPDDLLPSADVQLLPCVLFFTFVL